MSDNLPTVWPVEPHTLVKHAILRKYLDAWFPILARQGDILRRQYGVSGTREILFIDGFAGPGEYTGGEPGSPVIALEAAIAHNISFPIPVRLLFIELDQKRFNRLQTVLAPKLEQAKHSQNVHAVEPRQGDCDTVLNGMLDEYEARQFKFGPALAFLDQFGYGAVSMDLIRRVMSYGQCEVFSYLSYKEMNRWITDEHKAEAFTRAYGGEEWREARDLPERQRRNQLLEKYKAALKARAAVKYVVSFLMFDKNDSPLYWLLFCTNNLRGLEEMKRAMWAVDKTGDFRFSDRDDPTQLKLLEQVFDDDWLTSELSRRLVSKSMTAYDVKEFVLTETPCYKFRAPLATLEREKRLEIVNAPAGRIAGSFKEDDLKEILLRFKAGLFH